MEVVRFSLIGPLLILCSQATDFYYFIKHVYIKDNEKLTRYQHQNISIEYMLELLKEAKAQVEKVKNENQYAQEMIPMVDFVNELRTKLDVDRKIYNVIFGTTKKVRRSKSNVSSAVTATKSEKRSKTLKRAETNRT